MQARYEKKTWAILSDILNKNAKKSLPNTMTINGQDCKDKQIIAEQFNSFFATIGELNVRNIRKHNGSNFRDYLTNPINCRFAFHSIDLFLRPCLCYQLQSIEQNMYVLLQLLNIITC